MKYRKGMVYSMTLRIVEKNIWELKLRVIVAEEKSFISMHASNTIFIITFRKDNSCGYQENLLYLQIGLLVNQIILAVLAKCVFIFVTWGLRQMRNGMIYHALQQQISGLFASRSKRYDYCNLNLLKDSTFEGCFS